MKEILRVVGGLSIFGGVGAAFYTVANPEPFSNASNLFDPTAAYIVAGVYLASGLLSALIFFALATLVDRLDRIESALNPGGIQRGARATYLPGYDPNDPNPPGWNDPK